MARDYHNEIDPYAAQWVRNLIAEGLLPPGDVDERSIVDVQPEDLDGYTRCHFFAGLGGWPFALRLAGWPDDRPVWTGSCPCQPFSVSGKRKGFADERHLWPVFQRLIQVGRPPVLFGEQVARAPDWLRLVRGDLVEMGYAVGAIPMEAASADADHFRDRYWFVADRKSFGRWAGFREGQPVEHRAEPDDDGHCMLADCDCDGGQAGVPRSIARKEGVAGELDHSGRQRSALVNHPGLGWGEGWNEHELRSRGFSAAVASIDGRQYLECPDGKWRRLPPPGVRWMGTRIPARVAKLRAIGNAIDTRPAAEFIRAYLDCRP
ncbi:DNA cytosine methyltransferase [Xanthobacter autotrophicus]|uniref:DNA cytosine methyltransferase n=1 Tax=Xanthobacter autotrophicus TaxID=280 RepID=UPI00372A3925